MRIILHPQIHNLLLKARTGMGHLRRPGAHLRPVSLTGILTQPQQLPAPSPLAVAMGMGMETATVAVTVMTVHLLQRIQPPVQRIRLEAEVVAMEMEMGRGTTLAIMMTVQLPRLSPILPAQHTAPEAGIVRLP